MKETAPTGDTTRSHVRGSSLLLAGRVIAIGINFAAQVVIVRYLSKSAYGSYAFALSIAMVLANMAGLGFTTTLSRYAPIFRAKQDWARLFGSMLYMAILTVAAGLVCAAALAQLLAANGATWLNDPLTVMLMAILAWFIPIHALDRYVESGMAVFASPRAIFVRRHLVGPGLKLAAILYVVTVGGDARLLAWSFLVAGFLGLGLYVALLIGVLNRQGMLHHFSLRGLKVPGRELMRFGFPVMLSDLNLVARGILVLLLLEQFLGSEGVAGYRAVLPVADLNKLVSRTFTLLFIPYAAGRFAHGDGEGVTTLFRQSVRWIALLTFPIFLVSCALATPVSVLLFGAEYASSGPVLAILSATYYVHAVLSFSTHTMKVYGHVRWVAGLECLATAVACLLAFWWTPAFGEVGAAAAVGTSVVLQNLAAYLLMRRLTGLQPFDGGSRRLLVAISAGGLGLWFVFFLLNPPLWAGLPVALGVALVVFHTHRGLLSIEDTFSELGRVPFLKKLLG